MTTIKTQINGQPFEITVDDGLSVEFTENSLRVTKVQYLNPWWNYPYAQGTYLTEAVKAELAANSFS